MVTANQKSIIDMYPKEKKEQRAEKAVFCLLTPLNNYYVWNNTYDLI